MNPFEKNYLNKKFSQEKNLSFEEIYSGDHEEPTVVDDERDAIDLRLFVVVILLPFMVLAGRLYLLQTVRGSEYKALAEGNKLRSTPTYAPRGLIEDKFGKVIASNVPNFELDVVPADLPTDANSLDAQSAQAAALLGMDKATLEASLQKLDRKSYVPQTVVQSVPKDKALVLISRQAEFSGFIVQNNPIRDYKDSLAFSHLVGYTGRITQAELDAHPNQGYMFNDYIGKTGLESQYEKYLRGVSGQKQVEIDAQGNLKRTLADVPAESGDDIVLNIDYGLQKTIYDNLKAALDKFHLKSGAAVATDPKTGKVLALVSFPTYDNNLFAAGIGQDDYNKFLNDPNHPLLDRAISGLYPPGSTVKPMMALAALSEGVVKPETKILDDGVIRVGSFTYYGYSHTGLGVMDVYSAIARSSDIYFYTVGGGRAGTSIEGLGPDRIAKWFRKFNLGSELGIDLPAEKAGLVPDPAWKQKTIGEKWFLGDTYHYSIGQGDLLVTPLQMNSWTATIANGGRVMQPYILDQVRDKDGKVITQMQPHALAENQFDANYVNVVQTGMRQTVTMGTARSLQQVGMPVSGKTGTSQFDAKDLTRTHAWFTSYAPSDNPQIALTVLAEAGGEGGTVCVPVAHAVYDWWVANRLNK